MDEDELDSDDELMQRAFPVEGEEAPGDEPPATAEAYLRQVSARYEAKRLPGVVVSNIDPRKFDQRQTILIAEETVASAPPHRLPCPEWIEAFLLDFEALRRRISGLRSRAPRPACQLPSMRDEKEWRALCFDESGQPSLALTLYLDEVAVNWLLRAQARWISTGARRLDEASARWLFALLSVLEKPLEPELAADLRSVLRRCRHLRASLPEAEAAPLLPALNILICIIGRYFGQSAPGEEP